MNQDVSLHQPLYQPLYGAWSERVVAWFLDGLFELLAQGLLSLFFGMLVANISSRLIHTDESFGSLLFTATGQSFYILSLSLSLLNRIFVQWYFGGSVGKLLLGLRVVNSDQTEAHLLTNVARFFGYWLSALPLGLGFLAPLWNEKRQAFHDSVCGTIVIKVLVLPPPLPKEGFHG